MSRLSPCLPIALGSALLLVAGAAGGGQTFPAGEIPLLEIQAVVKQTVSVQEGGADIAGGLYGGQQDGCGVGTQGFVERAGPGGWLRCHDSDPSGACAANGGEPLFADFTSVDPARIAASGVHGVDVVLDVDEEIGWIAVAGELLTACEVGTDVTVTRLAFVATFDANGNRLADTVIGDVPDCEPPDDVCCQELCGIGDGPDCDDGDGDQCVARGVATNGNVIAITGSCWGPDSPTGRDLLVAVRDSNLDSGWDFVAGLPGKDVGLDVAIGAQGDVYATGHYYEEQEGRNAFVSQHRFGNGVLENVQLGTGAEDDEGQSLAFDADGNLVASGYIQGQAVFEGQPFGDPDEGPQSFEAVFDSVTLDLIVAEALPMTRTATVPRSVTLPPVDFFRGLPMPPSPPPPPPEEPEEPTGDALELVGCEIGPGYAGADCLDVLSNSNDLYLNITEGIDPDDLDHLEIELRMEYDPAPEAFQLTSLSIELQSDYCYTATLWLDGLVDDEQRVIGQRQVCPTDEPILTAEITEEMSVDAGLDGVNVPADGATIILGVEIDFGTFTCPNHDTAAKDASLDEVELDVDI